MTMEPRLSSGALASRLDKLKEPRSQETTWYGRHECGCSWDSGPYDVPCTQHDGESLEWDAFVALREAVLVLLSDPTEAERTEAKALAVVAGRMIADGPCA